jgi:hypothetical protein
MADPFDFSTADPNAPGFLGQSVGFWRDLASFGGNLAAASNARTASGHLANGTGFIGPFGAATTATMEQGRDNALARSRMAYQNAQTQTTGMQNQLLASQLPMELARNKALADMWADPAFRQQMLQFGAADNGPPNQFASGASGAPGGAPNSYAGVVNQGEGTGQNPRSSAMGAGQFLDSTWNDFAKANPQHFAGMTPDQVMAARNDPKLGAAATDWLAGRNAPALTAAGVQPTGQSLAMAHFLGPQAAAVVMQAPENMGLGQLITQAIGPDQAAAYIKANPALAGMTAGALRNRYAGVPNPGGDRIQMASLSGTPGQPVTANDVGGGAPQQPQMQMAQAGGQQAPQQPQMTPQMAMENANYYEKRAARAAQAKAVGFPTTDDPALLRQTANQYREFALAGPKASADAEAKAAVEMRTAGPIAANKAQAEAPYKQTSARAGSVIFNGLGQPIGSAPVQSDEVVTEGPNKGMHVTVLRDPMTNQIVGDGGSSGGEGIPAGSIPKTLPPQEVERLKASGEVEGHDLTHDRKMIEDDLSHVVENTIPAKQQLLHLRDLTEPAGTGFAAETRLAFKNAIQTIAPDFSKAVDLNASPMQEFQKISTMGAGKQERADQGAKGGFRLMELYLKANPNLENQPDANKHMANLLLVSHQIHEDYATGANDFYQQNRSSFTSSPPGKYTPISQYDGQFIQKMRPEIYKSAVDALNGKPYDEWSKGLTGPQLQIVGGVLQRADPNAAIDIQGHQMPVSAFTKTIGPTQIMSSR